MRYTFALFVLLPFVARAEWSEKVRHEMLESCTAERAMALPPTEDGMRKAQRICACAMRWVEAANPSPPLTPSMFMNMSLRYKRSCAQPTALPFDTCDDESAKHRPEWNMSASTALMHACETKVKKLNGSLPKDQIHEYCRCLYVRSEVMNPQLFADAAFEGIPKEDHEAQVSLFFELVKLHEGLCRNSHIGVRSIPLSEDDLRLIIYGKVHWRSDNEDFGKVTRYFDQYTCSNLRVREAFYRCYVTGNLRSQEERARLGRDTARTPSEKEEQAAVCARENPSSM